MVGTWQGRRSPTKRSRPRIAVATYRATVGLEVEQSSFSLSPSLDREIVAAAIVKQPEWCPRPWPSPIDPTDQDLRHLALLKMCFNFDFMSELEGQTGDEIRASLGDRFPLIDDRLPDRTLDHGFKRFEVEANVWDDGHADAGLQYPSAGEVPPLGPKPNWDQLDILIKNLARADIRDHLEREGFEW